MKHYLLSIQQPDGDMPPPPEFLEPIMRKVEAFNAELRAAGAWVFAGGLHDPAQAVVVRADGPAVDGPYTEAKEHVGGVSIIRAQGLAAALEWGRKLAEATTLPVEVREFQGEPASHLA